DYWNSKGHFNSSKSINELFNILEPFVSDLYIDKLDSAQSRLFNEYLKLDWLLFSRSGSMPESIERFDHSSIKDRLQEYLKNNLTNMEGFEEYKNMPLREILKHVAYEVFARDIFDINSSADASVMFYPIKQKSNCKNPFFIFIPLEEINPKG
ncbi:MAG TPA: DUF4080 domain-containing protein, partial [Patescibacteria group bacterium]|nr:DUF4080 domain-containing protein [Patescibacteria group bacterium]